MKAWMKAGAVAVLGVVLSVPAWGHAEGGTASYDLQLLHAFFTFLRSQVDSLLAMSAVGLTGIVVFIMKDFRKLGLWSYLSLGVSADFFGVSIGLGYIVVGASTGFFDEMVAGESGCSPSAAIACFLNEDTGYAKRLESFTRYQLRAGVVGFPWLMLPWAKIYIFDRRKPS